MAHNGKNLFVSNTLRYQCIQNPFIGPLIILIKFQKIILHTNLNVSIPLSASKAGGNLRGLCLLKKTISRLTTTTGKPT